MPASARTLARLVAMPVAGAIALAASVALNGACYTRACDGSGSEWGKESGQGNLIDEDTWESTSFGGDWVPFPHQARVAFFPPLRRTPTEIIVYISAEKKQGGGTNFTLAGGDVAKISDVSETAFAVSNGTCADFFVRVVARAAPVPAAPETDAGDAGDGGDADAGTSDAGSDAADAGSD